MIRLWRFGYEKNRWWIRGPGWRRLFWRLYWFYPSEERAWLERWALVLNVEPIFGERNGELRERLVAVVRGRK